MARIDLTLPELNARLFHARLRQARAEDPAGVAASMEHQQRGGVAIYLTRSGSWACARWSPVRATQLPMRDTIHDAATSLTEEEREILGLSAPEALDDAMVEAAADAEARAPQLSR